MEAELIAWAAIKGNDLLVNGEAYMQCDQESELTADLYKQLGLGYPKFFKMDRQCRLALLATEAMIRQIPYFSALSGESTGLVFSNRSGSMESDRQYLQTIADKASYFPSPSIFVYTLANILIGELAIKHKLTGENAFFVSERLDTELLCDYCRILFKENAMQHIIAGWVDVDANSHEAFVFCAKNPNFKQESTGFQVSLSPQLILQLYNQSHGHRRVSQ